MHQLKNMTGDWTKSNVVQWSNISVVMLFFDVFVLIFDSLNVKPDL